MAFFSKKQFKKNLRRLTSAPAVIEYEEGEENPVGVPPEEETPVNSDLEINEIAQFVNITLAEIKKLNQYKVSGVDFELNIKGHHIVFKVETKEVDASPEPNNNNQ